MKEEFTVYKAVRVIEGGWFVSCTTGHPLFPEIKDWELAYVLGEETIAHEGSVGILCFVGPWACARFVRDGLHTLAPGYEFAVLECVTKHVPHEQHWVISDTRAFSALVTHYEQWPSVMDDAGVGYAPNGTYVVPSLTPRRIYKEK